MVIIKRKLCLLLVLLTSCFFTVVFAGTDGEKTEYTGKAKQSREYTKRNLPKLSDEATLSDYLAYAALNNPGLEAAFNNWKAALEKVPQVKSLPDPKFTYGYFIKEVETRVGPQKQKFSLAQTFPWFGKLKLKGEIAFEMANAKQEKYEATKLKLFYKVKNSYYEYYYLTRAIDITKRNIDLVKYLESVTRTKFASGRGSHPDVIRPQVELGVLEDKLKTLKDKLKPVIAGFNASLNRPTDMLIAWPKDISGEKVEITDEQMLAWMRNSNPELRGLDFAIAKNLKSIDLAKKDYFPNFTIGVDYVDTDEALMTTADSGKDPTMLMFSVNLPIWHKKYKAAEREAEHKYISALKTRENKENLLSVKVQMAHFKMRNAERKIGLYRDTLIPKGEQYLKATETSYKSGKMDFLNLIGAQRMLLDFQLSYERMLSNYANSIAELEMLVGRSLSRGSEE